MLMFWVCTLQADIGATQTRVKQQLPPPQFIKKESFWLLQGSKWEGHILFGEGGVSNEIIFRTYAK